MMNDLRQWQHDLRVNIRIRKLAGDAADEIARLTAEIERLKTLGRAIVEANDEFRASLPKDWEGDPINDACEAAREIFGPTMGIEAGDGTQQGTITGRFR